MILSSSALFSADLLPLVPGNTWTYREYATGHEFTVRVSTPVVTNDLVYYSLLGYAEEKLLVRMNERHNLVYLDEETGREALLTSFEPFDSGWWQAPFRTCEQEGQTAKNGAVHDGPAGPFSDVLDIRYRAYSCGDADVESEQYAENIGMVRRVTASIAGPRVYNLVYAQVGSALIDTMPYGRFSVTVTPDSAPNMLTATLRLRTNSPLGLTLPFATAQEYEVQLVDAEGNVVWQWSDGLVFAEGAHSKTIFDQWSLTADIPKPNLSTGEPRVDKYTVRAWLTTEGAPGHAATAPITITSYPQ